MSENRLHMQNENKKEVSDGNCLGGCSAWLVVMRLLKENICPRKCRARNRDCFSRQQSCHDFGPFMLSSELPGNVAGQEEAKGERTCLYLVPPGARAEVDHKLEIRFLLKKSDL